MAGKRRLEPAVLTASIIPELDVTSLDAADVLEVYYMTRATELAEPLNIPITKASLGLRYRTSFQQHLKRLELTLEMGPRRTESGKETIPIVTEAPAGSTSSATVLWDNQANIYYSEQIEGYDTAHYLASISGTVVSRLLWSVLAYAKTRRYQPWQVVDANSTKLLLKSSADNDFLYYAFSVLAEMGVELNPVIVPASTVVQLHAVSIKKEQRVEAEAAKFYRDLHRCLAQIASGVTQEEEAQSNASSPLTSAPTGAPHARLREVFEVPEDVEQKTKSPNITTLPATFSPTLAPTSVLISNSHQEQAAQAANEAAQAAETAASANSTKSAQEAAVNAATAAQKAASVTASATADMAKTALFSNDAIIVTRTARSCMGGNTAYIYVDGTFWYTVQLASPFLSAITRTPDQLPQPPSAGLASTTDVIDWTLAFLILALGSVGMLLLIQQVLGRRLLLYKYQRKFFQPSHPDTDNSFDLSERDVDSSVRYSFGQDVIPLSMGGQRMMEEEIELRSFGRSMSLSSDVDVNDRLLRDPDMVELPNLTTSRSKVAVPVSLSESCHSL